MEGTQDNTQDIHETIAYENSDTNETHDNVNNTNDGRLTVRSLQSNNTNRSNHLVINIYIL